MQESKKIGLGAGETEILPLPNAATVMPKRKTPASRVFAGFKGLGY